MDCGNLFFHLRIRHMKVREHQEGPELNEIKQRIVYDDGNLMREN
jgi:hypothetical protein